MNTSGDRGTWGGSGKSDHTHAPHSGAPTSATGPTHHHGPSPAAGSSYYQGPSHGPSPASVVYPRGPDSQTSQAHGPGTPRGMALPRGATPTHRGTTPVPGGTGPVSDAPRKVPESHISHRFKFALKSEAQLSADCPSTVSGLVLKKEQTWQRQYTTFIHDLGRTLSIPMWGIAAAVMLCHRFYAVKSMLINDRHIVAIACLFLASKVEESPKHIRKVVEESERLLESARITPDKLKERLENKEWVEQRKEEILMAERSILYTLGFQLNINVPYKFLLEKLYKLGLLNMPSDSLYKRMLQDTWNLINDSLRTTLCLQYTPEKLAYTALYLASHLNLKELPIPPDALGRKVSFFTYFGISTQEVQDIADKLVRLYEASLVQTNDNALAAAAASSSGAGGTAPPPPPSEEGPPIHGGRLKMEPTSGHITLTLDSQDERGQQQEGGGVGHAGTPPPPSAAAPLPPALAAGGSRGGVYREAAGAPHGAAGGSRWGAIGGAGQHGGGGESGGGGGGGAKRMFDVHSGGNGMGPAKVARVP